VAKPIKQDVTGLILAGGRATRMGGVDKGLVEINRKPMVQHVIDRLRPQVGALIISANRNLDQYALLATRVVADENAEHDSHAGPMAGMLAGLRAATTDWVACAPCDAPRLPLDLVARLATGIGDSGAAVARTADGMQPVFCLLRTNLAADLGRRLRDGEHKAEAWLRSVDAVAVDFDDASAFANLNSIEDLKCHDGQR
jgi:molybdopterin-guanine dinucleotide biosynthesis protein A